jgi:hypothetical protein
MTIQQGWYLGMIKLKHLALRDRPEGLMLVTVVIAAGAFFIVALALISGATNNYIVTRNNTFVANSLLAAEAGVEQSVQQLNTNDAFGGYSTEQTFFDNATQGRGVFTTTVSASGTDPNARVITSTAKVYRHNSNELVSTRIVKVTAVGTASQGYSVAAGAGGLILSGSANITNSDVYVNGTIKLSGAAKIGTYSQPLNVFVANQACPSGATPGPTYPQVCTSGQPISLDWSTTIYGTVCATGQTSLGPAGNNIQGGNGGQGLKAGCTAPVNPMPAYSRSDHIASMTTTGAGNSNTYVCNSWPFDRTWPANLTLTGNVHIGSSCNVVIKGNVYITGDLTIDGAAKVTVDDSLGTTRPVIVADGKITAGGSAQLISNSAGTGFEFISFKSSASCGAACTNLTGNDLKTSSQLQTVNVGGGVKLAGMIFYAYWGKVSINGSGNVGSALGQTVDLSGAGTVTFGTALSSGARTWTISSYQQKYPGKP